MIFLLDTSFPKYYNRPELSIKFTDLFMNIFSYLNSEINSLKARDINYIIKGMINTGYNDKKFLHLLSTVYLKFSEKEEFSKFINIIYYFAVCDLENVIFGKKILDVLNLNLICLESYIDGNEELENLVGLYDRNFVKTLEGVYLKNIEHIKDKIKFFEKIQYNEQEILYALDTMIKTLWSSTFFFSKLKEVDVESSKLFLNVLTKIFNYFISNLISAQDGSSEIKIKVSSANIDKLMQAYLFFIINSEKYSLKNNLNLDFLKLENLLVLDSCEDILEYEKFSLFSQKVKAYINQNIKDIEEYSYSKNYSNLNDYNIFNYLKSDFVRIIEDENNQKMTEIIFINDPFNYFEMSMNNTGFNKFRNNLCKILNLKFREIDYSEFLIFFKDIQIDENNISHLVEEFLNFKLN